MSETILKIFSYLPNPRVWKAQIAADILGVKTEIVGDKPKSLAGWLWDFNARPLQTSEQTDSSPYARRSSRGFSGTLYKTDAFLEAHPFGTVPAAFSQDGTVGIFESNSILRAVARCASDHTLYGRDNYEASRIDSFLDAGLVFARESQVYMLGMDTMTPPVHQRMSAAYEFYLGGIERALSQHAYLTGENLTIADISFACDLAQFLREKDYESTLAKLDLSLVTGNGPGSYPRVFKHLRSLGKEPMFARYLGDYLSFIPE